MVGQANQNQKQMYAIAVRDGKELFLILSICRGPQGDVYVNFHCDQEQPHSSYHASGQHHQKSSGHKAMVRQRQKPDANFQGTVNVVTIGISSDETRAIQPPCQKETFKKVFEIPISNLRSEKYRTMISVDITEASGMPIITPGAKIILQDMYKDTVPWIQVTLFETD